MIDVYLVASRPDKGAIAYFASEMAINPKPSSTFRHQPKLADIDMGKCNMDSVPSGRQYGIMKRPKSDI